MPYYTQYKFDLDVSRSDMTIKEAYSVIDIFHKEGNIHALINNRAFERPYRRRWYNHIDEMKPLSELLPDVLLILDCVGEDSGDIRREYYFNGRIQITRARIVFDDFDESKFQTDTTKGDKTYD